MIGSETRVLTDENIHPEVVSFLRQQGCDVLDVKEEGLTGESDETLIRQAETERRIVVTHDRDFGRLLVAQERIPTGVIYLRPGHLDPDFTIGTLRALSDYDRPDRPFIVVAERHTKCEHQLCIFSSFRGSLRPRNLFDGWRRRFPRSILLPFRFRFHRRDSSSLRSSE